MLKAIHDYEAHRRLYDITFIGDYTLESFKAELDNINHMKDLHSIQLQLRYLAVYPHDINPYLLAVFEFCRVHGIKSVVFRVDTAQKVLGEKCKEIGTKYHHIHVIVAKNK